MDPSRRELLKKGAMATIAATAGIAAIENLRRTLYAPGAPQGNEEPPQGLPALGADGKLTHAPHSHEGRAERVGVPGKKWVMAIDLARCDGCGKCIEGCSKMHFIPPDRQWIKVLRMRDAKETAPYFFPQPCYHCDNPPCTKVCPVDATFKRQDGVVLIDNERCIGCRFCMAACPYSARSFNWSQPADPPEAIASGYSSERGYPRRVGTVEKCDFCPDMATRGELPACVTACPMGAIYFGDQNEDAVTNSKGNTERLSGLLKDRAGFRHMEELGTEPRVYYLAATNRLFPAPGDEKPR